jgi:MbtH protein
MADTNAAERNGSTVDGDIFVVLVNAEGQYSLWPALKDAPTGWSIASPSAPKADCLAYIETHWTDMRPNSLREAGEGHKSN